MDRRRSPDHYLQTKKVEIEHRVESRGAPYLALPTVAILRSKATTSGVERAVPALEAD
jgi:hypothetical protein